MSEVAKARPLEPGATIGILGGGQLARMLAMAGAAIGLHSHVFAPEHDSPAFDVSRHSIGSYDDEEAMARFADAVDVVTFEFENVPAEAAGFLGARKPVRPSAAALARTQDRLVEKRFIRDLGIETAPFASVTGVAELREALARLTGPGILKTRRFGYDGKGQIRVDSAGDVEAVITAMGGRLSIMEPAILEGVVPFEHEVSVVTARGLDGAVASYDLARNEHRHHILHRTDVPAAVTPATMRAARAASERIAVALGYVGVLCVEMFVVGSGPDERIVVNEIAPRVHNSGHWTIEGAETSQFEQHMRAVAGWPLGSTLRRAERVEMLNLIGDEAGEWHRHLGTAGSHLHLYGKHEARPGRKMGHVTRLIGSA